MTIQSIAGVVPPSTAEATVMTVWPSIAATPVGRWIGRLCGLDGGFGPFTVGRLMTLACLPLGVPLYFSTRMPWAIRRYRLTNRRVAIEQGVAGTVLQYVDLDRFDAIDVDVLPGQEWYHAGDLVFRRGPVETLRLAGVSRPEAFRQACLKVRQSYVTVSHLTAVKASPELVGS